MRGTVACALTFLALTCLLRKISLRLTLDISQSPDAALNRNMRLKLVFGNIEPTLEHNPHDL